MAKKNKELAEHSAEEIKINTSAEVIGKNKDKNKEKKLSAKQLDKKLVADKLAKKEALRQQHYKLKFEQETDLTRKQFTEKLRIKKSIIKNTIICFFGIGTGIALMLLVHPALIAIILPIAGITVFHIVKNILSSKKIKNPYEVRKTIILEEAKHKHNGRNKMIMDAYHKEKKRIKMLKRLPYKVLASASFLVTMFAVILFYFVLKVGVEATALIVFSVFTVTYFVVGLIMIAVFYMVSENKQREMMLKLDAEKNRLLAEEKLRSDNAIRNKLATERHKYEEEERLRLDEQSRIAKEEEEMKQRIEEERRLIEIAEIEKKKLLKETRFIQQDMLPPPSKAEINKEIESIKNDFNRKVLTEINNFDGINISGIEEFSDANKIKVEYAAGAVFSDMNDSESEIENEFDNSVLNTVKREGTNSVDDITDFDTADTEEAKKIIFENAKHKVQRQQDDTQTKDGKSVSGKSFMIIKQMLKDN